MAGETIITVVGNLTSDPELRYTQNGLAVANFTIASTPRNFDRATNDWKDGEALFLRGVFDRPEHAPEHEHDGNHLVRLAPVAAQNSHRLPAVSKLFDRRSRRRRGHIVHS